MSATAQQRMRIANEKAMKNVVHRGNVQKSSKTEENKYPVSFNSICSPLLEQLRVIGKVFFTALFS